MSRNSFLQTFYKGLIAVGESLQSVLLLAIRLFWGYGFFQSAQGKFKDLPATIAFFENIGIPFAKFNVYAVASIELVGGLLLMIGLVTRLVSIPLMIVMVGAYLTAHLDSVKSIFDDPKTFVKEAPFNYLLACLILFVFGPGKLSLDYVLERLMGSPKR
ncbi:MAG: DoxX family protein [Parachlamydiaceae bacterium]|nr:DoxX family protein [Parachlamydiaceae bacterium]